MSLLSITFQVQRAVFLLCHKYDPCYLYLGAIITRMGGFIGCGYEFEMGIAACTLTY
jgi:hypothetical protein